MKAILLAGGLGTRLRPLTNKVPKCLVPIYGKPLLQIWLERLSAAGISDFLVNTHHLSDQVDRFVCESSFRDRVALVHENELLGTAGTLIENYAFFQEEDGMLIHADNYCLADFGAFLKAHESRPSRCLMTMMTFRTDDPSSCGIVEVNDVGTVVGFHEKTDNPPGNLASGAIYILTAELLKQLISTQARLVDFSTQVLPRYVGQIFSYETTEVLIDVGTPQSYQPFDTVG